MNKGNSIRNGPEKDVYTPQKHVQSEQVIKIEFVSRSEREEGCGTLQELIKTCDYMEMTVYTRKPFWLKVLHSSHFGATNYNQILKFLKKIFVHMCFQILNWKHYTDIIVPRPGAKHLLKPCASWCGGLFFWTFLSVRSYSTGFSPAHRAQSIYML